MIRMQDYPTINITKDPNDKDSLFVGDLVGAILGIQTATSNVQKFLEHKESKIKKIKEDIPNILKTINNYFGEKQ